MSTIPHRIVVYPKDVSNMTGLSHKASRKLLRLVRKHVSKEERSFVTIQDFSSYTGINEEVIKPFLA
jgi:hypothetical protein